MSIAEQFRRFANIYFVIVVIMMYIGKYLPSVFETPLIPESTAFTLFIVMMVTSVKEGWEDVARARFDHEENVREVTVVTFEKDDAEDASAAPKPVFHKRESQQICAGDIIKLTDSSQVPADMVLLLTSNYHDGNTCFIETANLDGETNLKVREGPTALQSRARTCTGENEPPFEFFDGNMEYELPNKNMHNFVGAMHLDVIKGEYPAGVPLGQENVLLRGSLFSNTDWAYGVAIYTGQETKVQLNNTLAPTKMGKVERYANVAILIILAAQVALTTVSVIGLYALGFNDWRKLPYVNPTSDMSASVLPLWLEQWFIFFLLYINFIPISLYVTMELTNIGQAYMMSFDLGMYDEDMDEACRVKSSSLVQEPGIVSNIFSDKTGTLTRNEMKLVHIVIANHVFDVPAKDCGISDDVRRIHKSDRGMAFLRCLTTCHTIVCDRSGKYRAESPDELALVEGIAPYNCAVRERGNELLAITLAGEEVDYSILAVNHFNSDRKRMSVLVRERAGMKRTFLMCKGADATMMQLVTANEGIKEETARALLSLAEKGLRTLCVAHKQVSDVEADAWLVKYHQAAASMKDRARNLADVAAEMEQNLELLGITAIEDRLQDEVPEVIHDLAEAGIILWMLTGDKEETAVQIGITCNLLTPDTEKLYLTRCQNKAQFNHKLRSIYTDIQDMYSDEDPALMERRNNRRQSMILKAVDDAGDTIKGLAGSIIEKVSHSVTWFTRGTMNQNRLNRRFLSNTPRKVALIIDGASFGFMDMGNQEQRSMLLNIGKVCRSVIACRLDPIQKQQMVNIVKCDSKPSATTLAIGDGANDVSMIREAHVGVGIYGKEGRQAANNADFAIGQFKFLRRLTLVHGRWNYMRQSKVFLYSMHKNICMVISLFWYNYLAAMSSIPVYESWLYSSYNLVLGLPIICFGFLDQDAGEKYVLKTPEMYGSGKQNIMLSKRRIFMWITNAVIMGVLICLLTFQSMERTFLEYDLWAMGTLIFVALVNSMHAKMAFMHHQWTYINATAMGFSVGSTLFVAWFLSAYGSQINMTWPDYDGTVEWLYARGEFWVQSFFFIPLCVGMVDFVSHSVRYNFFPDALILSHDMEHSDIIEREQQEFFDPIRDRIASGSFSLDSLSQLFSRDPNDSFGSSDGGEPDTHSRDPHLKESRSGMGSSDSLDSHIGANGELPSPIRASTNRPRAGSSESNMVMLSPSAPHRERDEAVDVEMANLGLSYEQEPTSSSRNPSGRQILPPPPPSERSPKSR